MKVAISEIVVEEAVRIRKDIGDLEVLQSSIEKVGLINPVMIDENNNLLAGFRRLTACKNLGWQEIEVTVVTLNGDQIKMLDVEIAENFFRKDFTPEEILATEKRRQEILEQLRKKGFFEKFWAWLKSFFLPQPQVAPEKEKVATVRRPEPEKDKIEPEPTVPPEEPESVSSDEVDEKEKVQG